jgi:hypothetical protein
MYPPQYSWYATDPATKYFLPPVIKNIQISTSGPVDGHETLALIYEDALPINQFNSTSISIGERLNVYGFLRVSLFNNRDGNNISLDGGGKNSLLSYLKFSDLNPFNTYKLSKNPYKGLPDDYLIYRTCYPIRYESSTASTSCASDSTSVNVRIYRMTNGSFNIGKEDKTKYIEYDEWRDVAYYEYIREKILKKKICPNFTLIYGYYISEKININYDKINEIKNHIETTREPLFINSINPPQPAKPVVNNIRIDPVNSSITAYQKFENIFKDPQPFVDCDIQNQIDGTSLGTNKVELVANDKAYTGKALIVLTESAKYNMYGWASKTYQIRGLNVKEMVNRGTHTTSEWRNVLFQILAALYTMQLNNMYITNFTLEDNILIKDIPLRGQVTNYWKYKINGIEYFIPNIGILVLVDSNFRDLSSNSSSSTFGLNTNTKKVNGKFLDDKLSDSEIAANCHEMFKSAMDPNNYGEDFIATGGCPPTSDIMSLLQKISDQIETGQMDIGEYISGNMKEFMNNRIGSYLKDNEIPYIRRTDTREFVKGQIVVYETEGIYIFVLFIKTENGMSTIFTKNNNDAYDDSEIIETEVHVTSLINYSKTEIVEQLQKPNEPKFSEEHLLETYIIRKTEKNKKE